jgi:ligand-binding sensor domain-containing protein/signal transduction histidine kinase
MKVKLLLTVSLLLLSADLLETGNDIRFQRITITDGLSLSSVYCIFQDTKGFMWFGTEDGLNKFDGKNFSVYRPNPSDRNSLTNRWIEHIIEDTNGNLWFGSRGGLNCFDPRKEVFIQYRYNRSVASGISNDTITKIILDGHDYIWIGTLNGLNRINLQTKELERIILPAAPDVNLRINDILADNKGNMWIGTDYGLFHYDRDSKLFEKILMETIRKSNVVAEKSPEPPVKSQELPGESLKIRVKGTEKILSIAETDEFLWIGTENGLVRLHVMDNTVSHFPIPVSFTGKFNDQSIEKVLLDRNGNLWIVTSQGLLKFDIQNNNFVQIIKSLDTSHSLSINTVKPIFEDSKGSIWFGTFGAGLYRINLETGDISHFQNNPADIKSLSENAINCIYEDRSGRMFFGTFGAGISIYDPQANKFMLFRHNPLNPNSLSSNFVWSVYEDREGQLWIGTNDEGLNVYSPRTQKFIFYDRQENDPSSLSNSTVKKIAGDSKGNIWIGTDGGGLSKFDKKSGKFVNFKSVPGNPQTISNNSVRAIYEDSNGILWIGTKVGLNRFNPETQTFKRYLHSGDDPRSISNNFIYSSIYQDKNGFLWIGTYGGGLNRMDIKNETFLHFINDPDNPESIADDVVFSIYEDDTGIFWIGTNNGLNRYDPASGKFRRFGLNEGLPNEVIYGILPDDQNHIWMSTNHGISRFNLIDFSTRNFDVNDGLQSNEFNGGAYHRGFSGRLYFGGVYGLNMIDPEEILTPEGKSEVVITKLEILGHEVKVLPPSENQRRGISINKIIEKNGEYFLPENISFLQEIVLDYKFRFFSIDFSALNNTATGKINYAYQMENLEDEWNFSGERNYVSYANMRSGTYYFKVRTMNPNGNWNDIYTRLKITITPPFWESWWFIVLAVLFSLIIAIFIYRYLVEAKTSKLLKIQNEKINAANIKLAESEKVLTELNATKDKFFSIISHDLKNPLTSLMSISETIMEETKADQDEKSQGIGKIHESIKEIHALLENLLTWSRAQRGRLNFEPLNFNVARLIEVNLNLHRAMAENKNVTLSYEPEVNIIVYGDREMINTVIRNLVNNAIKFTPAGGMVKVETKRDDSKIHVMVKDSGTGISEENLKKLFRIDVKYKSTGTSGEKGTGLGLILCKEFVEKNGGEMNIESTVNQGSTFGFTIPAGRGG